MTGSRSVQTQALLMLLVANLFWGLSFPLIKSIMLAHRAAWPESSAWFVTVYTVAPRFLLATVILAFLLRRQLAGITRGELRQGLAIGLASGVGMLLQNDGLQFTAASVSAFLTQFYAIMIPVYVALRARQWPVARVWVSCALVLAGVAILGRFDFRALRFGRGEWETLASSVFFMVQILLLESKSFAGNRPLPMTLVMFTVQTALFGVLAGATAGSVGAMVAPWTSPAWVSCTIVLTAFCTLGAYSLMNRWQPLITATQAGLIYCVEPVFASLMALFLPGLFSGWSALDYPNERVTAHLLWGGGLITIANVLIQFTPPTPPPAGGAS